MKFLSGLFGRRDLNIDSYVRTWATRRRKEMAKIERPTPEFLFVFIIYNLSTFAKKYEKTPKDTDESILMASQKFGDDSILFEVGCYLFFRIDLWYIQNHFSSEEKEIVHSSLRGQFVDLFSKALDLSSDYINSLFDERLNRYGELFIPYLLSSRKGDTSEVIEQFHLLLIKSILFTSNEGHLSLVDPDQEPLNISILENTGLTIELQTWEEFMLPEIINGMRRYFLLTYGEKLDIF